MFFAQLLNIRYTTGFRVAISFLMIFIFSILLLFGYIYWKTSYYMLERIDKSLRVRLLHEISLSSDQLINLINQNKVQDPAFLSPSGLFNREGKYLIGGLQTLPTNIIFNKPYNFNIRRNDNFKKLKLRGVLYQLPTTKNILLIATDIHGLHEFNELLIAAMASSVGLILFIGVLSALFIGLNSQQQLDKMTSAIQKIMRGDLKKRLPVNNKQNDMNRLALILNQMLDEIERLMQQLKGACDDIAHDLRTPLTRLLAGLERLQRRQKNNEQYAQAIDQAIEEAQSLLYTFKALLKISEVENNIQKSNFSEVDLNKIIDDVVEFYEPVAEEKQILVTITKDNKPIKIIGDQYLLFDALSNLLDNAIKFTPIEGKIALNIKNSSKQIEFTIADNGIGIPEHEHKDVLRRFYRSEQSRNTPGNGLGLSMVAAVAHMHNLKLTIKNANPGCIICLTYIKS